MHLLYLFLVLLSFVDQTLQLAHGHVLLVGLVPTLHKLLLLISLLISEISDEPEISVVPMSSKASKSFTLVQGHLVGVILFHLLHVLVLVVSTIGLNLELDLLGVLELLFSLKQHLLHLSLVLLLLCIQDVGLLGDSVDLRDQNKLLPGHIELLLAQVLLLLVKVLLHLHVLGLQKLDMLVRSLFIIKQRANT